MLVEVCPEHRMVHDCLFARIGHSWAPPGKFLGHLESCPDLLRGPGQGPHGIGDVRDGCHQGEAGFRGGKPMSGRASGYHQKGTQELSEIRVGAGLGSLPVLGFFPFSERNYKVFSMEKNHGSCRDLEESLRDLCKGPRVAKQADGREGVS